MTPFTPQLYTPYQINFKQPMKLGCTRKPVMEVILRFYIYPDNTLRYYHSSERRSYPMTPVIWENILAIGGSFPAIGVTSSLSRDFKSEKEDDMAIRDYLVCVTIQEGIHEHSHFGLVKGVSLDNAITEASRLLEPYFCYGDEEEVKLNDVKPITEAESLTLQRLNIVHYMEDPEEYDGEDV